MWEARFRSQNYSTFIQALQIISQFHKWNGNKTSMLQTKSNLIQKKNVHTISWSIEIYYYCYVVKACFCWAFRVKQKSQFHVGATDILNAARVFYSSNSFPQQSMMTTIQVHVSRESVLFFNFVQSICFALNNFSPLIFQSLYTNLVVFKLFLFFVFFIISLKLNISKIV